MNKIQHNTNNDVYAFSVVPILRLTKSGQWYFISDYSDSPFPVDESWSPNGPEALILDPNLEDPSGVICYRIVEDIAIYAFDGSKVTPDGDINNPNSKCVFVLTMTIIWQETIWRLVIDPDEESDIVFYEDKYDHLRTKPKLTPTIARQIVEAIKIHCEKVFEQHSTFPKHDGNRFVENHYFSHTGPKAIMGLR